MNNYASFSTSADVCSLLRGNLFSREAVQLFGVRDRKDVPARKQKNLHGQEQHFDPPSSDVSRLDLTNGKLLAAPYLDRRSARWKKKKKRKEPTSFKILFSSLIQKCI